MDTRPRVLVLAPDLPYPVRAGGQMRMACFVEALGRAAAVHIACLSASVPGETLAWCTRCGVSIAHWHRRLLSGWRLWAERARMIARHDNLVFRADEDAFFGGEVQRFKPDLIWLETPYLLRYALHWRGTAAVVANYWGTSEGAERDFRQAQGVRRAWEWLRWQAAVGGEKRYAPALSAIVTVSELDATHFRRLAPNVPVWAIPNGVLKPVNPAAPPVVEDPDLLVFTGDLSYRPNVDAVQYLVAEVLPRVQAVCPTARLRVAGRAPSDEIKALARPGSVDVVGFVPDLAVPIAEGAVYVLPMRLGSGIRSKLFDVFPLGKAIVTTRVGAEGLELEDGRNCRIADTAAEFAAACVELLQAPDKRYALGQGARRLATEVYCQENVERRVRDVVNASLHRTVPA